MEIKPRIQSADTSKVSQETSNEQTSASSTPARVNFGVGKTQDRIEATKTNSLDSMLYPPSGPIIAAVQACIPAIMQEVIELGSKNKQKENPGNVFEGQLIGKAIGHSVNDGDDAAEKSGENERRSNSITSKD